MTPNQATLVIQVGVEVDSDDLHSIPIEPAGIASDFDLVMTTVLFPWLDERFGPGANEAEVSETYAGVVLWQHRSLRDESLTSGFCRVYERTLQ